MARVAGWVPCYTAFTPFTTRQIPARTMCHAGFPAVENGQAEVLVLGTLPGRLSLQAGEYYVNPRNGFWSIMGRLLDSNF